MRRALLRNDFVFFEVQQAAAALGAYSIPINWHGAPDEILYVLGMRDPKFLLRTPIFSRLSATSFLPASSFWSRGRPTRSHAPTA